MIPLPKRVPATTFTLLAPCMACNRIAGEDACDLCCMIEVATIKAEGVASPELKAKP